MSVSLMHILIGMALGIALGWYARGYLRKVEL